MLLVLAEHDGAVLRPPTLAALTAATRIAAHAGGEIHVLVAGSGCAAAAAAAARAAGVARVLHADAPALAHGLAEPLGALVAETAAAYDYVLAPATTFGKNVLPRAAALLGVQQISEITDVVDADTFVRPIYAGNALATVRSADARRLITVRVTAFEAAAADGGNAAVVPVAAGGSDDGGDAGLSRFVAMAASGGDRPELTSARVVVSGGRGMAARENFALLDSLADRLGAAVGASRAAVDAGYAPNDWQVGQTGKVVAPDLYIAVGISGAIQHLAGMKDSRVIVAVNTDPEAPIFQVADYGLVADLFEALPQLNAELDRTA